MGVAPPRDPFLFLLQPERARVARGHPRLPRGWPLPLPARGDPDPRGLLAPRAPALVVLAANFATDDPVAEDRRKQDRKRELREKVGASE